MTPETGAVLTTQLTTEQFEAAVDPTRAVLTIACAGSGKSRTLAYRVIRLLDEGADPRAIVAFTFTEKAAADLKTRIASALDNAGYPVTVLGALFVGTIHSYCQTILAQADARYRQFDVLDENRLKLYLMSRYGELGLETLSAARGGPRHFELIKRVAEAWKNAHDEMIPLDTITNADAALGTVLTNLDRTLRRDRFLDFSSMIGIVVEGLDDGNPELGQALAGLRHLMVDEYQDVNPAQERLIRHLYDSVESLFVVGDDDQSIYAWRGADVTNILSFTDRYPGASRHTLPVNFRSTPTIVGAAETFITRELGPRRLTKNMRAEPRPEPEAEVCLLFDTSGEEASWVADRIRRLLGTRYTERDRSTRGLTMGDFAILMRSTKRSSWSPGEPPKHKPFTDALNAAGIGYMLEAGSGVFDRPHVQAVQASMELLRNGNPTREEVREAYDRLVIPSFPRADFESLAHVLSEWGRAIHAPAAREATRRRLYPQDLLHGILEAFGIGAEEPDAAVMYDLGVLSRIIQDVESVFVSVDSAFRYGQVLNFMANIGDIGYEADDDQTVERPDLVFVSTVHRAKGLEFPVVFVVDAEQGRFPMNRKRYDGWLPQPVILPALDRGAYQRTPAEEARLFYTAVTRAERFLYVTASRHLPGGKQDRRLSSYAIGLRDAGFAQDRDLLPDGLEPCAPLPRISEPVMPTSYTDLRYYLRCPRDYKFRKLYGFSPTIPALFGFGQSVHAIVGKLHQLYPDAPPNSDAVTRIVEEEFHVKHVPQSRDPANAPGAYERARDSAGTMARNYVADYGQDFRRLREVEARFEVLVPQAVIAGSIDLLLRYDRMGAIRDAEVVDFKAMSAAEPEAGGETREALDWAEMSLQVQLYAKGARDVLGEAARTGWVHLLKDGVRRRVPVDDEAVEAALANMTWAVRGIIAGDFPMRPAPAKCGKCDFKRLCSKGAQDFTTDSRPPAIHVPGDNGTAVRRMARAFDGGD